MKYKLIIICSIFIVLLLCIGIIIVNESSRTNDMLKNSVNHIKLLEIESYNWGLVDSSSDYFSGTYYEVYRDGNVFTYNLYNKSGKKNEKKFEISIENITKIEELLKSNINKPADNSASDGTGWTFKYFDKEGNIAGEYTGYIYAYKEFNEILHLLKK